VLKQIAVFEQNLGIPLFFLLCSAQVPDRLRRNFADHYTPFSCGSTPASKEAFCANPQLDMPDFGAPKRMLPTTDSFLKPIRAFPAK
jgi:hypothetical protein